MSLIREARAWPCAAGGRCHVGVVNSRRNRDRDQQAPAETTELHHAPGAQHGEAPVEYQPECGALDPCDPVDDEVADRDPKEDI
jgi:hypothetical protein